MQKTLYRQPLSLNIGLIQFKLFDARGEHIAAKIFRKFTHRYKTLLATGKMSEKSLILAGRTDREASLVPSVVNLQLCWRMFFFTPNTKSCTILWLPCDTYTFRSSLLPVSMRYAFVILQKILYNLVPAVEWDANVWRNWKIHVYTGCHELKRFFLFIVWFS